jgi:TRAP transporter TAXI family solute receptor
MGKGTWLRSWISLCVASLLTSLITIPPCLAQSTKAPSKRITFASHTVGTSNHAITTALCKVASEHSDMLVVVSPTSGAAAWVPLMGKSAKPEVGMCHILDAWWAYTGKISPVPLAGDPLGTKPFYSQTQNLRTLVAGPRMWAGILVQAKSPYKTLKDAVGKKMAGGFPAQVSAYAPLVAGLHNVGLTEKDFQVVVVPGADPGVRALMEDRVELAVASIGMPAVSEANATKGVRFLPFSTDAKAVKAVAEVFPGATVKTMSPGPAGVVEPTPLMTYPLLAVSSVAVPEEMAYRLVKSWWDHHQDTWSIHPACKGWNPKDFVIRGITVPYHPGAIKFYKEAGAWSPEMDTVQARLIKGEYPFLD